MITKRRSVLVAFTAVLALILSTATVGAETTKGTGSCYFNGTTIVSDFDSDTFAKLVNDLQPGDEATFEVTYTNKCPDSTDWYMENTIEQTLEKTKAAKKVSGTGTAEGGGYTYELTHYDKNNRAEVLFSNEKVGGDTVKENMEGLEQATNALDDWFYIQTLKQGESGRVVIHVAFDGETEVNDYMDTDGGLNVRFAVELTPTTTEKKVNHKIVKTGDNSSLLMWTAIAVGAGIILLILALISRRKEQPEAGAHDVRGRRVDRR